MTTAEPYNGPPGVDRRATGSPLHADHLDGWLDEPVLGIPEFEPCLPTQEHGLCCFVAVGWYRPSWGTLAQAAGCIKETLGLEWDSESGTSDLQDLLTGGSLYHGFAANVDGVLQQCSSQGFVYNCWDDEAGWYLTVPLDSIIKVTYFDLRGDAF